MKRSYLWRMLGVTVLLGIACQKKAPLPRVFVFTDINIDQGDPDDRQSLIHLLWYANQLNILGIVPDRWEAEGYEACQLALEAYEKDYQGYQWKNKGYPTPEQIDQKIAQDTAAAFQLFEAALADTTEPIYVLVWGNMRLFQQILDRHPESADHIRLITIGTGLMLEKHLPYLPSSWPKSPPCEQLNWNGFGRQEVYDDPRFRQMWWLEINWTFAGMFEGTGPKEMYQRLSQYGTLGKHMQEVVANQERFQYFRVGDTPSVLYVLDEGHDRMDPTAASWAGRYFCPFPGERPDYFTDLSAGIDWNYQTPCETWAQHERVDSLAQATLLKKRPEMYQALLTKLNLIYGRTN